MFKTPAAREPSAARTRSVQRPPGGGSGHIYRDDARAAGWEVERLVERRARALDAEEAEAAGGLYARRVGRAAAGSVAVVTGIVVLVGALLRMALQQPERDEILVLILMAGWPLAALAYALARGLAGVRIGWLAAGAARLTGDAHADLARLQRGPSPAGLVRAEATALEAPSIGLPLAGLAFLTPLSLHLVVAPLFGMGSLSAFGEWIRLSAMIVGHAHVVLAVFCAHFAWRVKRTADLSTLRRAGWTSYGITVAASAVPGVALFALPPAIVAATGIVFIPFMFGWARRRVGHERVLLADAPGQPAVGAMSAFLSTTWLVRLAGIGQLLLVGASLAIPGVMGWREETRRLRPLTRQVFWTYAAYIFGTNAALGLVSALRPDWLTAEGGLGRAVCGFAALWWGGRLVVQFAWFDRTGAPAGARYRLAEAAMVALFAGLTLVYGAAAVLGAS